MVQKNKPLFVVENYVDALVINYYLSDYYSAVPTFSVSYWSDAWVEEIAARKPSQVIVAFDPDLAGNGPVSKAHARRLFTQRICKIHGHRNEDVTITRLVKSHKRWSVSYTALGEPGQLNLPAPFGLQRVKSFLDAGLPAKAARWEAEGKDIGDYLSRELKSMSQKEAA